MIRKTIKDILRARATLSDSFIGRDQSCGTQLRAPLKPAAQARTGFHANQRLVFNAHGERAGMPHLPECGATHPSEITPDFDREAEPKGAERIYLIRRVRFFPGQLLGMT